MKRCILTPAGEKTCDASCSLLFCIQTAFVFTFISRYPSPLVEGSCRQWNFVNYILIFMSQARMEVELTQSAWVLTLDIFFPTERVACAWLVVPRLLKGYRDDFGEGKQTPFLPVLLAFQSFPSVFILLSHFPVSPLYSFIPPHFRHCLPSPPLPPTSLFIFRIPPLFLILRFSSIHHDTSRIPLVGARTACVFPSLFLTCCGDAMQMDGTPRTRTRSRGPDRSLRGSGGDNCG